MDRRRLPKITQADLQAVSFLSDLYLNQKLSIPDIARTLNWAKSKVRNRLIRLGVVLRTRTDGVRLAGTKGKYSGRTGQKHNPHSSQTRLKIKAKRLAWAEKHAKGTRITSAGYVEFTRGPNKGRAEHTVVIEDILGRKLLPHETVHHKDHVRTNNDPNNLCCMTRSDHASLHAKERNSKRSTNAKNCK